MPRRTSWAEARLTDNTQEGGFQEAQMLPDIRISLPIILVLWCLAAVWTLGPVMLAYPAIWAVVGIAFWLLDRAFRSSRPSATATTPAAGEAP